MRVLKDILTLGGAACIGWAVPNLVASVLPFYGVNNLTMIGLNSLVLTVGVTSLIMGYGVHRRALFAWWLGCFSYLVLVGYLFWRLMTRLEIPSFYILIFLIGEWPFAALWWRYAKLYFADEDDE